MIEENALNNNSLVFKISYNKFSCIFTGDIEEVAERKILELYENSNILKSTILKVAHHGSKTSSIDLFLEEVNPQIALIRVGKDNKFGHPDRIVLSRILEKNCKIYRTDINGEIRIVINKNGKINVKTLY